jgi:hypothetical protein
MKSSCVIIAAAAAALALPACRSQSPLRACENVLKQIGKENTEENRTWCYREYFWPMREAAGTTGQSGELDEKPHIACYIDADSKAAVEKCLEGVKAEAARIYAKAGRGGGGEDPAVAKTRVIEGCVSKCSAQHKSPSDEYKSCFEACKKRGGL